MKKNALPLLLFLSSSFYLSAQKIKPVNPAKDKMEFQGYTIRIIPAMRGTYGYDILKGKALIAHQSYNPFTMAPVGLRFKDDVYKVAKWQVAHMNIQNRPALTNNTFAVKDLQDLTVKNNPKTVVINKPLGKALANQLNINIR